MAISKYFSKPEIKNIIQVHLKKLRRWCKHIRNNIALPLYLPEVTLQNQALELKKPLGGPE